MKKTLHFLTLLLFIPVIAWSQTTVSGKVVNEKGEGIPFATIIEAGTFNGNTTDEGGVFEVTVSKLPTSLIASFIGFETKKQQVTSESGIIITLKEASFGLDEIVVTGNRAKPRTVLDSPVPVDNIGVQELKQSGQDTFDQMLAYKVPSFNSANQAISDATAHFDPADLRGLGPSRTLVLINGKRKNQSAQIYLNGTPGKGEVGIDLKSIPTAAIARVEVLRDGASAQYGSDAIAGVINIILKEKSEYAEVTAKTGITSEGDGFNFGTDFNTTFSIGEKGHVNFTAGYYTQELTNRAGSPGTADLPSDPQQNWVDWATNNPELGMIVGQPDLTKTDVMANVTYPISDDVEFYTFHGFTKRDGRSFAYYRAPYWRSDVEASEFLTPAESFEGYHPTFEVDVKDNISVAGLKFVLAGFNTDLSLTYGRNSVDYTVNRSVNRDYLADHGWSPRTFHPGGYAFSNVIGNLDFSKVINDQVSLSFGFESKKDIYQANEGDPFSYYGGGSDSFAGIKPSEAGEWDRTSFAAYAGLDYDITEAFLIGGAVRYEDFSDFGSNTSWKLNGRYKIGNTTAIRASASTGFRAPSLHQRHITLSQYIIVPGFADPQLQGTLANDNPAVVALGVPNLSAETSDNFSFGATSKLNSNLSLSVDLYNIKVKDRVLFSSQIKSIDGNLDGSDQVEQILLDNDVLAVQFFINAVNTKTTGADIVLNYKGDSGFSASLAANFNKTEIDGAIANPATLEAGGYEIFNRREAGRITDARPKNKILLGLAYKGDKFNVALNNTSFGEVTVFDDVDPNLDQVHSSKIVTDLILGYNFDDKFSVSVNANNLFDVYPDVLDENLRSAGGRFLYSSEVTQMGFKGANYSVNFSFKF